MNTNTHTNTTHYDNVNTNTDTNTHTNTNRCVSRPRRSASGSKESWWNTQINQ